MKSFHFSCFALVDVEVLSNDVFLRRIHFPLDASSHILLSGNDYVVTLVSKELRGIDREERKREEFIL